MTLRDAFLTILGHPYSGMYNDNKYRAMYEAGRVFGIRQGRNTELERVNAALEILRKTVQGVTDDDAEVQRSP